MTDYGQTITSKINKGGDFVVGGHTGEDHWAPTPTTFTSPVRGTVVRVGSGSKDGKTNLGWDYGNWLVIRDVHGFFHFFAHLTRALVAEGETVNVGDPIVVSGRTGNVTGGHLHWAVYAQLWVRNTLTKATTYIANRIREQLTNVPAGGVDVRKIGTFLNGVYGPKYHTNAASNGIRGAIYWRLVQMWGKANGLYGAGYIINGVPGAKSRSVEAYLNTHL